MARNNYSYLAQQRALAAQAPKLNHRDKREARRNGGQATGNPFGRTARSGNRQR